MQGWGIVHTAPVLGERRDHFVTTADVWEMFQLILDERKKREIDPTLALLKACVEEAEQSKREGHVTRRRLRELHDMIQHLSRWYTQIRLLPTGHMIRFVKMGSRVGKVLGLSG